MRGSFLAPCGAASNPPKAVIENVTVGELDKMGYDRNYVPKNPIDQ